MMRAHVSAGKPAPTSALPNIAIGPGARSVGAALAALPFSVRMSAGKPAPTDDSDSSE
jgi:hypothetical protein